MLRLFPRSVPLALTILLLAGTSTGLPGRVHVDVPPLPLSLGEDASAQPDLVVASLAASPANATAGDEVTVNATVSNEGAADAGAFNVTFSVDGGNVTTTRLSGLAQNSSASLSFSWTATAGDHQLAVTADSANEVNESNEANNRASIAYHVASPPAPDLVVASLLAFPANATEGDHVVLNATIANRGTADAGAFDVSLALDGQPYATARLGGLAANATASVAFGWNATAGNHTFVATADASGEVNESNETNNQAQTTLHASPKPTFPDLVALSLVPSNASPAPGQRVNFTATIANQGAAASGPFNVSFTVDGATAASVRLGGLAPGNATNVTFAWNATVGNHTFVVEADSNHEVNESSEANNRASATLSVAGPLPDLRPEPIFIPGNATYPGQAVLVQSAIDEIANASAGPSHAVFYVDGAYYDSQAIGPLPPGGRAVVSFVWYAQAGAHTLSIVADGFGEVAESNEGNNVVWRSVFVPPWANLGIRIVNVTHDPLRTDAGNAPNPLARHRIAVDVTNHANFTAFACLSLNVTAQTRHVVLTTGEDVAGPCANFAPGTTRAQIVWDPLVAVGDVTLTARVTGVSVVDPDPSDDTSSADDYVIVGGLGGVVVPAGA